MADGGSLVAHSLGCHGHGPSHLHVLLHIMNWGRWGRSLLREATSSPRSTRGSAPPWSTLPLGDAGLRVVALAQQAAQDRSGVQDIFGHHFSQPGDFHHFFIGFQLCFRIFMGTCQERMSRVTQGQNCWVLGVSAARLGESVTLRSGSKGGRRRVARGIAIGRGTARARARGRVVVSQNYHLWLVQILVL